jgi:hypothetical protein
MNVTYPLSSLDKENYSSTQDIAIIAVQFVLINLMYRFQTESVVFGSSVVDRGLEPLSGQTKDNNIYT